MLLFQAEADRLLQLPKEFDPSHDLIEFRRSAFRERYDLFEILVAINALTRDRATSTAFAVSDVRLARGPETLQAFAFINDQESTLTSDYLDALRNYEIAALRWSRPDEALVALQS